MVQVSSLVKPITMWGVYFGNNSFNLVMWSNHGGIGVLWPKQKSSALVGQPCLVPQDNRERSEYWVWVLKLQYETFWPYQIHIEMWVTDLSFSLKASLGSGRSVQYALFLCFPFLSFVLVPFTFVFFTQYNVFSYGKIFHSGLDGTMILYTILACFVT